MAFLKVSGISFSYASAKHPTLNFINLSAARGETLALLGPNGSGKTTLLRILSTLLSPSEGSIELAGSSYSKDRETIRRRIGVVFQSPALDRRLTVEENLCSHAHLFGLRWAVVSAWAEVLLRRFEIWDRRAEWVQNLSGGLERRVELAKALIHRPEILLLDEPTASLDPAARILFWKFVSDLRREFELTVVVSTHQLDEAAGCDSLALLDRGEVIAFGAPEDLLAETGSDFVTLRGPRTDRMGARVLERFKTQPRVSDQEVVFQLPKSESMKSAVSWVQEFASELTSFAVCKPKLEDLYLERTGRHWESSK